MEGCVLVLFFDEFVLEFVHEELHGVVVMTDEFVVSVDLVCHSPFLNIKWSTPPSLMSSTGVSQ